MNDPSAWQGYIDCHIPGLQRNTRGPRLFQPVEPHHREPLGAGGRADLADVRFTRRYFRALRRSRAIEMDFHDTLSCRIAVMNAGDNFLADIAALLEIDAVQKSRLTSCTKASP